MTSTFEETRSWISAEIRRLYGIQIIRVILCGSRARGNHRPDSDWDVVVLLREARFTRPGLVKKKMVTPDGNQVAIVSATEEDLNDPGRYMTDCRKWGIEL